jgi:hypothetical protein
VTAAADEYERVREKYAPARWRDIAIYALLSVALGIATLFRHVDWYFWAGTVSGAIVWEFTKLRLRRNARDFAEASR